MQPDCQHFQPSPSMEWTERNQPSATLFQVAREIRDAMAGMQGLDAHHSGNGSHVAQRAIPQAASSRDDANAQTYHTGPQLETWQCVYEGLPFSRSKRTDIFPGNHNHSLPWLA